MRLTGKPLEWDVWCTVKGGGFSGQAGAIKHGVAQALQAFDIEKYRPLMKRYKLLTFDCRQVERKKPGQPKARKKFQVRFDSSFVRCNMQAALVRCTPGHTSVYILERVTFERIEGASVFILEKVTFERIEGAT